MKFDTKILDLPKFPNQIGLDRLKKILFPLHLLRPSFAWIHIAGTKGKGSTSIFLANILIESGYKVGLFLSPHLSSLNERITINLVPIQSEDLEFLTHQTDSILQKNKITDVSFFEYLCLVAFQYFTDKKVDVAIIETGLGGRLDATNAFENPVLSVLTTIGIDHIERLGSSIESITLEKAGILKSYTTTIISQQPPNVEEIILKETEMLHSKLYSLSTDYSITFSYPIHSMDPEQFDLKSKVSSKEYKSLKSNLLGKHQVLNASLAVASSELLSLKNFFISEKSIKKAIQKSFIPGRFEVFFDHYKKDRVVILDGAHNPESAICLAKTLQERFSDKKVIFLFSALQGKLLNEILVPLIPLASYFQFTSLQNHATYKEEDFKKAFFALKYNGPLFFLKDPIQALEKVMCDLSGKEVICVTGSLYLVGLIRDYLQNREGK